LELIVTPSDNYPTLLSGKVDEEDDDESNNTFKILHKEEQEDTLELKVDLSAFVSHELPHLLWHFGTRFQL